MIGKTLGHYRILEQIGAGGMGVVYRAHDQHLQRDVAIKVLPAGTLADDVSRKRFHREALALSRLNHPHVAAVYDFDTHEGVDFLVMELAEGVPLSARLEEGRLAEAEAARLGAQIAEALDVAHVHGVVHRDLKPGNIMVTDDGQVKVLDFGLARLVQDAPGRERLSTLTEADVVAGTVAYMAPEQLLGGKADPRSDLHGLGVVLYHMVTGRLPWRSNVSTALVYEIANQAPPSPRSLRSDLSPQLDAIILRCLAKDPASRYPSARELARELRAPEASRALASARRRVWRRRAARVAVSFVLTAVLVTVVALIDPGGLWEKARRAAGVGDLRSLAVLPFENLSRDPEQEYFADGMTEELITRLARIGSLTVIARGSVMGYKKTVKPLRQVARELHADALVTGSVLRSGGRTRISAQLVHANTGKTIWADSFEGELRDVLQLQARVAGAVVGGIRIELSARERAVVAEAQAVEPSAHEAYLRGLHHANKLTRADAEMAIQYYRRAIEVDPTYALAYAGMAEAFCIFSTSVFTPGEAMPRAKAAALRALEIDSTVAVAHLALAYVTSFYDWKWPEGERQLRRAIQLAPGSAFAHLLYGYYLNLNARFGEALAELRRARTIDPLSPLVATMNLWPLFEGRRYEQAIRAAHDLIRTNPNDPAMANSYLVLGQAYVMQGDHERGLEALRTASRMDPTAYTVAWTGLAHARAGRRDSTRSILAQLDDMGLLAHHSNYAAAILHTSLGDSDRAFEYIDRLIEDRSEDILVVKIDPALDPLRSDPRFADVLRRLGFGS